ncbi:MAG: glycogen/starch/alpha-glucan phosphorylase [Deltaproteobacteria bacterium]|nr:glycogen/starch/alpha-glucan phosphorylase [Deltaproteobacteria bacterium]
MSPRVSKRSNTTENKEAKILARARELPNARTGMDADLLRRAFAEHLQFSQGKDEHTATALDRFFAVAFTVRDRLMNRWIETQQAYYRADAKRIYYLSLEFLMGRALTNNLINLGMYDTMRHSLEDLGIDFEEIIDQEIDAGLGNGGLGRLAACFLDSMATLSLPAYGYGIRYEFGIFDQNIVDGFQVERPEAWLRFGCPWEVGRPEYQVPVHFNGHTERQLINGKEKVIWIPSRTVLGMPYDIPVAGYRNDTVNTLRLWRARASEELDLADFNAGDYLAAVEDKNLSENISKVLYPNDLTVFGKELRLQQQYFFVACSIADIVRRYLKTYDNFSKFTDKVAIQLNDTHPAIAIVELMRVLIDENNIPWEHAWKITQGTFGYTNHTLLPEALEKWSVDLFGRVLPRHLEIIYKINQRFLDEVHIKYPNDNSKTWRLSLIEETPVKQVRMAHLAVIGSHSINGVAKLHTDLLKRDLFADFYELWPKRFNSKTNGVTLRRWLLASNPKLASLITECIDGNWIFDASELRHLEPMANDSSFRQKFDEIKRENKKALAQIILDDTGVKVDPDSMFDVQIKRMHEYKRQLLNVFHVITLYHRLKNGSIKNMVPRTVIFGGKAAPGYLMAKNIIKLINSVADVINNDPDINNVLKVIFLKNYRVSLAERMFPASELSEQISTAGKEASGTGNMKFALNGALTIGTLDGANVEIRDEVGAENFFLFGLTVEEVKALRQQGYNPNDYYQQNLELKAVIDSIQRGDFSLYEPQLFRPIIDSLLHAGDFYMLLADYESYIACQEHVNEVYRDRTLWNKMAILNVARTGYFSSDRTIQQYADEIWHVTPIKPMKI